MSVLLNALDELDQMQDSVTLPWERTGPRDVGQGGVDLPDEMIQDFYDLREYIRIANMRGVMRVLAITSSVTGEGASTISTYLAMLMAGAHKKAQETEGKADEPTAQPAPTAFGEEEAAEKEPAGEPAFFNDDFRAFVQETAEEAQVQEPMLIQTGGILLIDAHLHKPSLHQILQLPLEGGLSDILEQQVDWRRQVKPLPGAALDVITAGKSRQNPAELLGTEDFRRFIQEVREQYRYVLIDTPAVLNYVDSLSVTAVVDGVILVVRAGQTRWEMAQNAKRKLLTAHATLLGVALNRRKPQVWD
ncbi:MAG TPA: CpsD/CapB family tyrosine-protein kinase [bacterium]|nr:CpsD/CapB family tyrosine-protein kinase [bacterium]